MKIRKVCFKIAVPQTFPTLVGGKIMLELKISGLLQWFLDVQRNHRMLDTKSLMLMRPYNW